MSNGAAAGIAAGMAVEDAQRREIARLRAERDEAVEALSLFRSLVDEGGAPRYTVTSGAALNSIIEEIVDPLISRMAGGRGDG